MSNEIDTARGALLDQLHAYTAGALAPERVHRYTPVVVATPCIWIAQPGVATVRSGGNGARVRVVNFGVYIVPDGYQPEQCALLDELVARIADAVYDLPRAEDLGAVPQPVDIGGTTVRCVVQDVAMSTFAHSFCTRPAPTTPRREEAPVG